MSTEEIRIVKRFFESKSVHVSDYWMKCCLEWFKGEHNTFTEDYMCKSVYQQWLDSDLRDLDVGCLPNNLSREKEKIINGKYAVQVMYLKDVSKSSYTQLKRMRDMFKLTGSYVSKEDEDKNEPPGKRMLYLHMTDGIQYIYGFEYHTVRCLDLYLTPGVKLLLKGPLIVRNGEFLLKENNVDILGGEVEDLLVVNAAENILARELKMPENPNPINRNTNSNTTQNNVTQSVLQPTNCVQTNNKNNQMLEFEDEDFLQNLDTSVFEEIEAAEEAAIQADINQQELDLDEDDDLFKDLNITENIKDDFNISQAFESRLEQERSTFPVDAREVIEERPKKLINLPVVNDPDPFIYIKYLLDNIDSVKNDKIYRVKARFVKTVEKLQVHKNERWTMKFEIQDSSASVNASLSSEVIGDLMGLSPAEALMENLKVKRREVTHHEKMTRALAKCKEKLKDEYLMDLKFNNNDRTVPTIINLQTIQKIHLQTIKNRVRSLNVKLI